MIMESDKVRPRSEPSQEHQENTARLQKKVSEKTGKRRAKLEENKRTELTQRIELAKTFSPGEIVETGGMVGTVKKPDFLDIRNGTVRVQFGRAEPVSCSPLVLKKREIPEGSPQ